jgi:novel protein kinase C delta type
MTMHFFLLQRHPMDVSYFESAFTADEPLLTPLDPTFLETVDQLQFKGFSYTNTNYTLS